jgi:hypothetical protein
MSNKQDDAAGLRELLYRMIVTDRATDEKKAYSFHIPPTMLDGIQAGVEEIGITNALKFAWFGAQLARRITGDDMQPAPMTVVLALIRRFLTEPTKARGTEKHPIEEQIRALHYRLVGERVITWEQAAALASEELGEAISTAAWRKRVLRWAEQRDLPPVALRQRYKKAKPDDMDT